MVPKLESDWLCSGIASKIVDPECWVQFGIFLFLVWSRFLDPDKLAPAPLGGSQVCVAGFGKVS